MMAKKLATLDVLSGGRVDVVVGVGGRDQDYLCAERPFGHRHQTLDDQVAELRRLWSGGAALGGAPPVGPTPVQEGGPPVYASAMGPKSTARAAQWADGNRVHAGAQHRRSRRRVRHCSRRLGGGRPRGPAENQHELLVLARPRCDAVLHDYAYRYLEVFGADGAEMMAGLCTAAGLDRVADGLARLESAGCDEVYLVPTTLDPAHLGDIATLRP